MILTGPEIIKNVEKGKIKILPFDAQRATTNSYDLKLGLEVIRYISPILDPKEAPQYEVLKIPPEGLVMQRGDFLLASTEEKIGSDYFVPIIHALSGVARIGLFVHVTAYLIDIGSFGTSTLQLFATLPIRIYRGMLIAQVSFWVPEGEIKLYKGKYQHSEGPQPSLTHLDWRKKKGGKKKVSG